jgi:Subtilase family/FG-GAP-like repeat
MKRARVIVGATLAIAATAATALAFPDGPPNDPLFDASPLPGATNEQWDLHSDTGISVDRAWALSTGAGETVADVDVGVQLDHPDLKDRWWTNPGETGALASNGIDDDRDGYVDDWRGWDFYEQDGNPTSDTANAHGTNVAGVLGAAADNGIGIAGIAPNARIMALRTSDNIIHQGARIAQAIVYAADHGAAAISMSLGADTFGTALRKAVRYAHRRNVVMAVASGNEFHFHHHYPQLMDDVLAVGGVNPDTANTTALDGRLALVGTKFDNHAQYSDYGPHLDVVAPTQVPTAQWGGGNILNWSGTSAATPHVAGVATLVAARGRQLGLNLSADEIIQLIRMTATDLTDPGQGYAPGWDRMSGWGEVNAYEAVAHAKAGKVPPVANITRPDWYEPVATGYVDVKAIVHGRSATTWDLELGRDEQPATWQKVASGAGTGDARQVTLATIRTATLEPGGWTLRLRIKDANGNLGEDREFFGTPKFVALPKHSNLAKGFPLKLGTSGEASPQLADLDKDGRDDIVLPTSDGKLRVISGRRAKPLKGWPRSMRATTGSRPVAKRIGTVRSGFVGTPAIGDIAGSSAPEVVATGLDGRVYAWTRRGKPLRGFPYRIGITRPSDRGRLDAAIYASPALSDLDGDGKLDIVFGAADQRVYAVKGDGTNVPGWPVTARDGANGDVAKILSSPAIGDLDGDHRPDIVEGTAEVYGSAPQTTGRVYAWNAKGKLLPGWPVKPSGLAADAIPIVGEGVPVSPVLADVDGDRRDEVAIAAFTGEPELYRGDGTRMTKTLGQQGHFQTVLTGEGAKTDAPSFIALGANQAFGRTSSRGPLKLFGGGVDSRLIPAQYSPALHVPFDHLLGGWDAASGDWLPSFPIPMEGWTIVTAPTLADVDGDGNAEVVAGSSGNMLHAFKENGAEPGGWPKQAYGWLLAAPTFGDVDGDGRLEVVAVTRDGWLWVWHTPARASAGALVWPSFRHDLRNTGRYG